MGRDARTKRLRRGQPRLVSPPGRPVHTPSPQERRAIRLFRRHRNEHRDAKLRHATVAEIVRSGVGSLPLGDRTPLPTGAHFVNEISRSYRR